MPDIYIASDKKKEKKPEKKIQMKEILKEVTTNPLAAFVANPPRLRFETQDREEKIILLLRRHIITNLSWLLLSLVLVLSPTFIFKFFPLDFLPSRFHLVVILSWYLVTFAFVFEKFLSWYFNVNIITDERIVDIDFPSILYKKISDTKIDQVQDVTVRVGGFSRSLFNYGDVLIQTAGTVPEICFEAVPNPERVSRVLDKLMFEEEQEKIEGRVR